MFKRIGLFLITNLAIIIVLSVVIFLVERFFGIDVTGYAGGNYVGLLIFALMFGFGGSFISLLISKWMAKRAYGVVCVRLEDYSNLSSKEKIVFDLVRDLAERSHITMPEVGFYQSAEPNAFATGASKNNSLVAVSSGLLNTMNKDEIEGVIAHEMAHILNGDMVTMTLLQGVINTFVIFISRVLAGIVDSYLNKGEERDGHSWAYMGLSLLFEMIFGILASLITMWFSRHREYRADAGSAEFVGKNKMIAALEALKNMKDLAGKDNSELATMKISTKGKTGFMMLFSTHPDLDDRINALKNLNI
ncbi:MAG: protease HtpX [Candidatus Gracilibacteria bacterium]|nr:protease HtpX [Candidatus Gracilibacteria bacterium]